MMTIRDAKEYWLGTICFCATPQVPKTKKSRESFCPECMSKLPEAMQHEIENTQGKEYLEVLAACETEIMKAGLERK